MPEGVAPAQALQVSEELQLAGVEGFLQVLQKQSPEQAREHPDRQEEAWLAGGPSRAVRREPATRDDAVEVGMMEQIVPPGVQNGEETDLGPRCLGSAAMVRSVSAVARKSRP